MLSGALGKSLNGMYLFLCLFIVGSDGESEWEFICVPEYEYIPSSVLGGFEEKNLPLFDACCAVKRTLL